MKPKCNMNLMFHHGLPSMVFVLGNINYEGDREFFARFNLCPHFRTLPNYWTWFRRIAGLRWLNPWRNWQTFLSQEMRHSRTFLKSVTTAFSNKKSKNKRREGNWKWHQTFHHSGLIVAGELREKFNQNEFFTTMWHFLLDFSQNKMLFIILSL